MLTNWIYKNHQVGLDTALTLLVFFIPISKAIPNILLIPVGIFYCIGLYYTKQFKPPKFWYLFLLLILSLLINSFIVDDFINELGIAIKMILGTLIFLIVKQTNQREWVEKAFYLGITISILYSLFQILKFIYYDINFSLGLGEDIYQILLIDRPYLGFSIAVSNAIILYNIRNDLYSKSFYFLCLFFFLYTFLISARLSIILSVISFVHHAFLIIKKIEFKHIAIGILSSILILTTLFFSPSIKERMRIGESFEKTIESLKAYEPRYLIWKCSMELLQNDGIMSFNSHHNLQQSLDHCYSNKIKKEEKLNFYLETRFNTHNQFFDILLSGGIIAFLIFISMLVMPFLELYHQKSNLIIIGLIIAFFVVENVLLRELGCYLFGIFAALTYKSGEQKV